MVNRRTFLGTSAVAGLIPVRKLTAEPDASIKRYVKLGKTGLEISEIGFGSSSSQDPDLIRYALDRGVTYFDTAESYRFGWSEEALSLIHI